MEAACAALQQLVMQGNEALGALELLWKTKEINIPLAVQTCLFKQEKGKLGQGPKINLEKPNKIGK